MGAGRVDPKSPPPAPPALEEFTAGGRTFAVKDIARITFQEDGSCFMVVGHLGGPWSQYVFEGVDAVSCQSLIGHVTAYRVRVSQASSLGSDGVDRGPGVRTLQTLSYRAPQWLLDDEKRREERRRRRRKK